MNPELTGITWEHARGFDCMVAAADVWSRTSGVAIRWERRSLQSFADQPLTDLVGDHDLLVIDHPHVPLAAKHGLLLPLDDPEYEHELSALARHSVGASHESYRYDGHQWALATDAAAQVAAYRPDLLTSPPRTWDDVLELAASGRVLWPGKPMDAFSSALSLAAAVADRPEPTSFPLANPENAQAALDLLHRLAELTPPRCLTLNPIDVAELLADRDDWVYAPMLFGYSNFSRLGHRRHRLRYIDAPRTASGRIGSLLGGAGIAVSAQSRHPGVATSFAYWIAQEAVQTGIYFDAGGQPGHGLSWESERTNSATLDFFAGTRSTLEAAYLRPQVPEYLAYQDALAAQVTACLRGDVDDARLIDQLIGSCWAVRAGERNSGNKPTKTAGA